MIPKNTLRTINKIIIHCSDSEQIADVVSIKQLHMNERGWRDIGYHWVVTRQGEVQVGRPEDEPGAHCKGFNSESFGICLGGRHNFDYVQLEAMRDFTVQKLKQYGLSWQNVFCHHELDKQGKTCPNLPGDLLRAYIKAQFE